MHLSMQQLVTSSPTELDTSSKSDVIEGVVSSSSSSLSDNLSLENLPQPCLETLLVSK